jgi:hypothetical protein
MNNKIRGSVKEEVKSARDKSRDYKRMTHQLNTGTTRNTLAYLKSGSDRSGGGTLVAKKKVEERDEEDDPQSKLIAVCMGSQAN